jgi:hypothetical protein
MGPPDIRIAFIVFTTEFSGYPTGKIFRVPAFTFVERN